MMTIDRLAAGAILVVGVVAGIASPGITIGADPSEKPAWTRPGLPRGPYDHPLILTGVTEASGSFFAFGHDEFGSPAIITSENGDDWRSTAIDPLPTPGNGAVKGVAARAGLTVAVGAVGGVTVGYSRPCAWLQRPDGTWQVSPLCSGTSYGEIRQVVASEAGFVALGVESTDTSIEPILASWVSTDGLAWNRGPFPRTAGEVAGLATAGHRIVALGFTGRRVYVYFSSDGKAWQRGFAFPHGVFPSAVAYGDRRFVATDGAGYPWWSRDGRHWSVVDDGPSLSNVAWTGDGFVATPQVAGAVAYGADVKPGHLVARQIWTSADGRTWLPHRVGKVPVLSAKSIASGAGRTVVLVEDHEQSVLWVGPADLPNTSTTDVVRIVSPPGPLQSTSWLVVGLGGLGGLVALRRGRRGAAHSSGGSSVVAAVNMAASSQSDRQPLARGIDCPAS